MVTNSVNQIPKKVFSSLLISYQKVEKQKQRSFEWEKKSRILMDTFYDKYKKYKALEDSSITIKSTSGNNHYRKNSDDQ